MKIDGLEVEDTYAEAFDGLFCRLIITARDEKRLNKAVGQLVALPSTVFGEAEGGVERTLDGEDTPDGRVGALVQLWVNYTKDAPLVLEKELAKRIRQGVLVVPTTRVFNAMDSDKHIDTMDRIGHCGDGFEKVVNRFGREMISIPIMMGDFLIERHMGYKKGIMGGNIWLFCESEESALSAGDKAVEAVGRVSGAIASFGICAAGSKVETKFPEIGPTTNEHFCPTLKDIIPNSEVPEGVESIPEIVINGRTIGEVEEAMREAIKSIKAEKGVLKVSAGNFGGKLGKYKIYLKDIIF